MKALALALLSSILLSSLATGCYRMPGECDYCIRPATNDPALTRQRDSLTPGVSY